MDFNLSRRDFGRFMAGAGAAAAMCQLGRTSAMAAAVPGYKAMVGVFLFGGNDGWNMVVPTDARYPAYAQSRGSGLALPLSSLVPLASSAMALHPAMAPLQSIWNEGALGVVLNTGTLYQPLTKAGYQQHPELRPINLMSHADEQGHWQGLRAREINTDGFMGRLNDRVTPSSLPAMISFGGSNLAILGQTNSPLVLPSTGVTVKDGATQTDTASQARNAATAAFADGGAFGQITSTTAKAMSSGYSQMLTVNQALSVSSAMDAFFVNPATGATLSSDVSRQLLRTARLIEARQTFGHSRQTFFVTQGGYDTHSNQVNGDNTTGSQANLLGDLAMALSAFYNAIKSLGLSQNVTTFTMSDFGRVYKANAQRGTDHAWGSNHLVLGGALRAGSIHGAYPDPILGGADDAIGDGRFIPTIAQEEYIGAIAQWHGVASADMSYVFPNWSTWTSGGRGPVPLFAT